MECIKLRMLPVAIVECCGSTHLKQNSLMSRISYLSNITGNNCQSYCLSSLQKYLVKGQIGLSSTGSYAINPASQEQIPIWVADYVLGSYGSGAIMAVPAHDSRDYEFAQVFNLPIKQVVRGSQGDDDLPFSGPPPPPAVDFSCLSSHICQISLLCQALLRFILLQRNSPPHPLALWLNFENQDYTSRICIAAI